MPVRQGLHVGCVLPFHVIGCPDWVPEGETFEAADALRERRLAERREERERLRRERERRERERRERQRQRGASVPGQSGAGG